MATHWDSSTLSCYTTSMCNKGSTMYVHYSQIWLRISQRETGTNLWRGDGELLSLVERCFLGIFCWSYADLFIVAAERLLHCWRRLVWIQYRGRGLVERLSNSFETWEVDFGGRVVEGSGWWWAARRGEREVETRWVEQRERVWSSWESLGRLLGAGLGVVDFLSFLSACNVLAAMRVLRMQQTGNESRVTVGTGRRCAASLANWLDDVYCNDT